MSSVALLQYSNTLLTCSLCCDYATVITPAVQPPVMYQQTVRSTCSSGGITAHLSLAVVAVAHYHLCSLLSNRLSPCTFLCSCQEYWPNRYTIVIIHSPIAHSATTVKGCYTIVMLSLACIPIRTVGVVGVRHKQTAVAGAGLGLVSGVGLFLGIRKPLLGGRTLAGA